MEAALLPVLLLLFVQLPRPTTAPLGAMMPPDASKTLGVIMHTHGTPEQLAPVVAAGISIIRTDFSWASTEPVRGRYDFNSTDTYIGALKGAGLRLMAIMDAGGHPLYDAGKPPASPEAVRAYGFWVGNFTQHYVAEVASAQIVVEITNEPNGGGGYKLNASNYARIVEAAATAAHGAVPAAQICGPSTENIDIAWMTQVFEGGALQHFDQITVHPYRPDSPETALVDLAAVKSVVAEFAPPGKVIPVQVGEWGYTSADSESVCCGGAKLTELQHAHLVARLYLVSIAAGSEYCLMYEWADGPNEKMGLRREYVGGKTGAAKLAYNATMTLGQALRGHRYVQRLPAFNLAGGAENPRMEATDDFVLSFAAPSGDLLLVAWTSASFEHVVRLPGVRGCWEVTDWRGRPLPAICSSRSGHAPLGSTANDTHVSVTSAPLYLRQAV